jgi:hypothetical protein
MSAKQRIMKLLRDSSPDLTVEDAIYKLEVLRKIELGAAQLDRGEGIDHDELFDQLLNNGKTVSNPVVSPRKRRSTMDQGIHKQRERKSRDRK